MAKINYPKGEKLARLLLDVLAKEPEYKEYSEDMPYYHISFEGQEYYLYFKCVTHEGNPYPLEHRRAQLPKRPEFDKIKNDDIPFLFLGYDVDNDLFVCWEPSKVKPRLNNKGYVSFYSRLSIQESVVEGKIRDEYLTNGDKFVLFKRVDTVSFFQMIDTHFVELKHNDESRIEGVSEEINTEYGLQKQLGNQVQGRIIDVEEDSSIQLAIDAMADSNSDLKIVAGCMNEFSVYYPKMSFADWSQVIRKYLKKIRSQEAAEEE